MDAEPIGVVPDYAAVIGESPLWSAGEGALYWLDLEARLLLRTAPPFIASERRVLPYKPGCLALRPDGRLLVGYRKGIGVFDFATAAATQLPLAGVGFDDASFNDGIADAAGRLWIGTRHREATEPVAALYRITPDLAVRRMVDGVVLSNGIAFSPDQRVLYHADSRPGRIDAWDFDAASGEIGGRRVFVDYAGTGRRPDGCTVDADGFLWVAEIDGWRVARYAPDGRLDRTIMLPVRKPSSVGFGGGDMATLFVTTIRAGLSAQEEAEQPLAGRLLMLRPGVRGMAGHTCRVGM
jgi:L-arabinonolactonase